MCGGTSKADAQQRQQSAQIDRQLVDQRKQEARHIKLLLLGAGESGKSTIAKQMKIIHLNGFTDDERLSFKSIIYSNLVGSAKVLVEAANSLGNPVDSDNKERAHRVLEEDYFTGELTAQIVADLKALWADPAIQQTFAMSSKFQLNDSAEYYFQNIERLATADFIPDVQDVLRSRAKTTGIIETDFYVKQTRFTLVDVGGQRSERRKWMHCFENVTAVIFCIALSEYDQKLYEDEETNRMHESLKVFQQTCNNEWFTETAMILFFNKKDLFAKKILKVPLTTCFADYTGPQAYKECVEYIVAKFLEQNTNAKKLLYHHETCATDTNNIQVVFKAVQDILLTKTLEGMGM